ncbi:hypothetical protein [Nocardiopsis sp. CC223A]|uniref:hypothetical protein n=1 Tax=Nocardiopsis sp. CC223A TaxID=3044051 RepID=UPI00278C77D4|nr:hypothetical protein [Nocardiopsis sp. CC223A]
MSVTPDLTPLLSFLPALLFIVAEITLGIAAMAAVPRLPRGSRGAAVTGGVLVLAGGLLQAAGQLLLFNAPDLMNSFALPMARFQMLSGILSGTAALVFAGGVLALVLAATRAPVLPGAYPPPGTRPYPGR